jgi:hypothetical protein
VPNSALKLPAFRLHATCAGPWSSTTPPVLPTVPPAWSDGPQLNARDVWADQERLVKVIAIALCGAVLVGCVGARASPSKGKLREDCRLGSAPSAASVPTLPAGDYRLTLHADCGRRKGSSSEGSLTLVPASPTDQSSTSGAVVVDLHGTPQFYGWTPLDFQSVDASICSDARTPPATSRDPMRPGALVLPKERAARPIILIGTLSNLRTGSLFYDGCGIGLVVNDFDGTCYRGTWGKWGIFPGGSGTFRACPGRHPATK